MTPIEQSGSNWLNNYFARRSAPPTYNTSPYSIKYGQSPYRQWAQYQAPVQSPMPQTPPQITQPQVAPAPQATPQIQVLPQSQVPPALWSNTFDSGQGNFYQTPPQVNLNPESVQTARNLLGDAYAYVRDQAIQNQLAKQLLTNLGLGGAALLMGRTYAPYGLAAIGAYKFGRPIVNGITKFVNSPVGKTVNRYADKVIDWLW